MTSRSFLLALAAATVSLHQSYALAETNLEQANTCLSQSATSGQSPAYCVDAAQSSCLQVDAQTPAVATLCYVSAEKRWQAGISDLMQVVKDKAPEEIAAIAAIEVKYDLLSALLQCDRMEELSLLMGRQEEEAVLRQDARCKANAAGLTYARLFLRSQSLR